MFIQRRWHLGSGIPAVMRAKFNLMKYSSMQKWRLGIMLSGLGGLMFTSACIYQQSEKGRDMPMIVSAKITRFYRDAEGVPKVQIIVVSVPEQAKLLASFFPNLGEKNRSPLFGGWIAGAKIDFYPSNSRNIQVWIDTSLAAWSEGQGDWQIAKPKEFRTFMSKLLR